MPSQEEDLFAAFPSQAEAYLFGQFGSRNDSHFLMQSILQAVTNFAKIDIQHLRIADVREKTFLCSMKARIYRTGPFYITISAMTFDLVGPGGRFAQLEMPEIVISPGHAKVALEERELEIMDGEAFRAFTKSLVSDRKTTMGIENGRGTIKAMGMTVPINFSKTCEIRGMNGPRTEFVAVDEGKGIIYAKIFNPSPLEMDLGNVILECRNASGTPLARVKGRIVVLKGASMHEVQLDITLPDHVVSAGDVSRLRVVGISVEGDGGSWMKENIQSYDVDLPVTKELLGLIRRRESQRLAMRNMSIPVM